MAQVLSFPANTDGNRIAEFNHGLNQDAHDAERDLLREEYKGKLAIWLSRDMGTLYELAELIADDYDAIRALFVIAESDPADAVLHLLSLRNAYCERVEQDRLEHASASVLEDHYRPAFTDDQYQAAQIKLEEFAKELSQ